MVASFRGRLESKIDQKGRFVLPQSWRTLCDGQFILANAVYQKRPYLDFFTETEWSKLESRFNDLPSLRPEVQAFLRFYVSSATKISSDSNGRILVPPTLRGYAKLEDSLVMVGMGNKIEIWSQAEWSIVHEELVKGFEQNAGNIAGFFAEVS
ncbi:MAG: hypothetical protein COT74_08870 [Bdellovibrionales bacterium CG10_big_fil_rev_8_21_14_0_10_45_34]|nr:MAG: hypothetical protein COT74_08870 [Bdellovibrionales bacterium CG10_big_fil_rev_8_21_14_0_10_45_34]